MPGLRETNTALCSVVFRGNGSSIPVTAVEHSRTYSMTGPVVRGRPHVNERLVCAIATTTKSAGGPISL